MEAGDEIERAEAREFGAEGIGSVRSLRETPAKEKWKRNGKS
jgi:hypothetical protein